MLKVLYLVASQLCLFTNSLLVSIGDEFDQFVKFQERFNKKYEGSIEFEKRFNIFKSNLHLIVNHNLDNH
jgi:hypothetical protein